MTGSPVGLHEFNRIVRITLLVPVTVLAILAGCWCGRWSRRSISASIPSSIRRSSTRS